MMKFTLKLGVVVGGVVLIILAGYYVYLTRTSVDQEQVVAQTEAEDLIVTDTRYGAELSGETTQILGTYDSFDGNRVYAITSTGDKYWVYIKPKFDLYCVSPTLSDDAQFVGESSSKSSYDIAQMFQIGDSVLLGTSQEGTNSYLDKILTNSKTACKLEIPIVETSQEVTVNTESSQN